MMRRLLAVLPVDNRLLAVIPLLPPLALLLSLFCQHFRQEQQEENSFLRSAIFGSLSSSSLHQSYYSYSSQLLAHVCIAILGFLLTNQLIPHIQQYTLRRKICGKDLGKRGTATADQPIPEALGIVPGAVFLVCLIVCLVGYAATHPAKLLLDVNSALLSICFMLFLGFTDDVLDWPWRYKLVLPSIASLPLLCCYTGSTSIVVPIPLRSFLWHDGETTVLGQLLHTLLFIDMDSNAQGSLLNLKYLYFVYMGMLAVFCTNAINIYAGINGLEAGQSYVIGCAILVHNLWEIHLSVLASAGEQQQQQSFLPENHLFSIMIMSSFVGVTAGLLRHNWYPASVFVGDTFCYFAGMTVAVVGILGHFSKTLLLFFIPQIINFVYSMPQLFRLVPCPRHRLPKFDPKTGTMSASTFSCHPHEYQWLKKHADDTEAPNMTLICLTLQILGPLTERELCIVLLGLQIVCCCFGFFCRYYLAHLLFES